MYCPDDIVTNVNNGECDAFDPLCDYDAYDCCEKYPGRFDSIMFGAMVLLSYYVTAAVVRCAQVLYTENRQHLSKTKKIVTLHVGILD